MKINLIYFGKASSSAVIEEANYFKRIRSWNPIDIVELKPSKSKDSKSGLLEEVKRYEQRFASDIPLIIIAEEGKVLDSVKFSEKLQSFMDMGKAQVNFLVGSSYGIHDSLKAKALFKWSLTPLTLTHDHARILLIEQIYRALCIQKNHPYHHV